MMKSGLYNIPLTGLKDGGHVYEFTHLGLPIKKVHPEDEDGFSGCDPEMLKRIDGQGSEKEEDDIDPRWKDLGRIDRDLMN